MEGNEREILFGGYNARGQWVEGSACKDEDNTNWLIIGPFRQEETSVESVYRVYQYTDIDINGQEVFEESQIIGGYQWMDKRGNAQSREINDKVVWRRGGWVLESTDENLFDLVNNNDLYWDVSVMLPQNN